MCARCGLLTSIVSKIAHSFANGNFALCRCLEASFLELSQQSQVALSNAAAQVSTTPHGLPSGPMNSRYSGSGPPQGARATSGNYATGGIAGGNGNGRGRNSSSNLTSMSQGGMQNRGYNSAGNLNTMGGNASYGASNPYTTGMYNNTQGAQGQYYNNDSYGANSNGGNGYYNSSYTNGGSGRYNNTSSYSGGGYGNY